jgi:hypothetical protein
MAPANPVPQDRSGDSTPTLNPFMDRDSSSDPSTVESGPGSADSSGPEPVSQEELNAWRRGLTPQAEIWNGRLAMLGLSMGLIVLILSRLVSQRG